MAKFYRVIKDHPLWEVGTILSNEDGDSHYCPTSDLFVKDIEGVSETWSEGAELVENQPEWFERVYKVSLLKQVKYLAKDKAREAQEKLYQA